jgi:diguanylate cyclase (GGDEF)-like protein
MYSFDNLLPHLFISTKNAELNRSQFDAIAKQIPLLYLILLTNSTAVAITHFHITPAWLSLYVPLALGLVCAARVFKWLRIDQSVLEDQEIARQLRSTTWFVIGLGIAFTSWGLALYPYGDAYERTHVALYMSVTVIGCIFCLMHVRTAALLLTVIVIVPFTVFFSLTGNSVLVAISVNVLLVSIAMVFILLTYYRDFANLVDSKQILQASQRETQKLNDENFRLANIDSLTLLPNRRCFFASLEALITSASAVGSSIAVGVIDLDGFKQINDLYGHATGDRILAEAGMRLAALSSPHITMARLGGDEFGLLMDGVTNSQDLLAFGAEICTALRKLYVLPEVTATLSCSLGFAIYPGAGNTGGRLYERAGYALNFAKEYHHGDAVIFSREHEDRIRYRSQIEQSLRCADLESELRLDFQPIFDMTSNRILAFEALARWTSPILGPVAPCVFIPAAERTDLIHSVTQVLLSKALGTAANWPADIRLSFNLSVRDVASADAIERIIDTIRRSGVAPDRIDLEVTESALICDFDQAHAALNALKQFGVKISLDDFGTGYSSLRCVHRLPLDKIKVDRSFVVDIVNESISRDIVKSIVDLCHNLGIACVIEGVESASQVEVLRELGGTIMQGYFFGKPVPAEVTLKIEALSH